MKKIQIMGVLNVTPNSFSDGGDYFGNVKVAVDRAIEMVANGANIVDVGGESIHPGADPISKDEELRRIIPVIKGIKDFNPGVTISIDSYKPEVADAALNAGANIVNSLGGFTFNKKMLEVVLKHKCKMVIYHISGKPKNMQQKDHHGKNVISNISKFFRSQIKLAEGNDVDRSKLILDPGIGFGKTPEQCLEIVRRLDEFSSFGLPVMIGISRKSYLGFTLQKKFNLKSVPPPLDRLEACLAQTAIAVQNGATIVRTHDVLQTKKFLSLL